MPQLEIVVISLMSIFCLFIFLLFFVIFIRYINYFRKLFFWGGGKILFLKLRFYVFFRLICFLKFLFLTWLRYFV